MSRSAANCLELNQCVPSFPGNLLESRNNIMDSDSFPESHRRVLVLGAIDGEEPPASLSDRVARNLWDAATAPWHPAILAQLDRLPEFESLRTPSAAGAGDIVVLGDFEPPPNGYRDRASKAGATVIDVGEDRTVLIRAIFKAVDPSAPFEETWETDKLALDYLALGAARRIRAISPRR